MNNKNNQTIDRKLRMGMVGGGINSFIGSVHREAAVIDGQIEFVSGALSSTIDKSKESAKKLLLDENRSYGSWEEMLEIEKKLDELERIDLVSIVTPNHLHFQISKAFIESGFYIICDKPMTYSLNEAIDLVKIVQSLNLIFSLTLNYTGYPMVKQARHMVQNGYLGSLLKVIVEYSQGWLLSPLEKEGHKQAEWRVDPKRSGISNCMGDIGSHCENLIHYITGREIEEVCADLNSISDRLLDNDGNVLIHLENGIPGILNASQISTSEENNLNIRVYGKDGSIEWYQEEPNTLWFKANGEPAKLFKKGTIMFTNLQTMLQDYLLAILRVSSKHLKIFT